MKMITHERASFSLKASLIDPEPMDTIFEFVVKHKGIYCATYQMTKAQIRQCPPLFQAMQTRSYNMDGEYHWSWGNIPQEVEKFRVQDSSGGVMMPKYIPHQCPTCGEECECDLVIDEHTGVQGIRIGWTLSDCTHEVNYKAFKQQVGIEDLETFNFTEFADRIYRETPKAHPRPFLLPALYGGELSQSYEALFVLEAPSKSFTEDRWIPCDTTEMAIQNHRVIFFDWAFRGKQAHLFGSFVQMALRGARPSYTEFIRRFYVTDIWKDATPQENRDRRYKKYWLSKLALELERVPAKRVIFIGREAERGRRLVRNGLPIHYIPFPGQWRTENDCREDVARLHEEIRTMP